MTCVSSIVHDPVIADEIYTLATSRQLLVFLQRLQVSALQTAAYLGVHPPAISMWLHNKRAVPARYRLPLQTWTRLQFARAIERHQETVNCQPSERLRFVVREAFYVLCAHWALEVMESRHPSRQLQHVCQDLAALSTKYTLTLADLEMMETLVASVTDAIQGFRLSLVPPKPLSPDSSFPALENVT